MSRVLYFLLFGFLLTSLAKAIYKPLCGPNEEPDICLVQCDYDDCPTNSLPPKPCAKVKDDSCEPGCKCIFNYRRAENGSCIPTTECPPFQCSDPLEAYDPCPPYCPSDNCGQASETGECPFPGFYITAYCTPACRCIKGYWKKNGTCVPYENC